MTALATIGKEAVGYAQDECPVDTGTLKNSIDSEVIKSEMAVYIGTNVEYAPYVEFIDRYSHYVGKAHFLRDAMQDHTDRYAEILKAALEAGGAIILP